MATVLVLDVKADEFRIAECNEIEDFYRELDAQPFDIARRKIDGKMFDIFIDDMGLLRDKPKISAISKGFEPMLVGNLVFANHDSKGNTTSLTDEDMARILSSSVRISTKSHPDKYTAIVCEY